MSFKDRLLKLVDNGERVLVTRKDIEDNYTAYKSSIEACSKVDMFKIFCRCNRLECHEHIEQMGYLVYRIMVQKTTEGKFIEEYENPKNFEVVESGGGFIFQRKLNFDLQLTPHEPPHGNGTLRYKSE